MKKIIFGIIFCACLSCFTGCKTENKVSADNAYPLTNQVYHTDGTKVQAPTW